MVSRCWSNTVSRETLQKTPAKEMKRQEAIYELIYTEEDYVRDLNLLDEVSGMTALFDLQITHRPSLTFYHGSYLQNRF